MTTLKNTTAVENFLSGLNTEIDILYLVNVEDIDKDNAFYSILEMIEDRNGFDIDVIYYSEAMKYLMENDNSLRESLEIAKEYGFELDNLSSETLASLLKSQNVRNDFNVLENEINDFFSELEEEEENED